MSKKKKFMILFMSIFGFMFIILVGRYVTKTTNDIEPESLKLEADEYVTSLYGDKGYQRTDFSKMHLPDGSYSYLLTYQVSNSEDLRFSLSYDRSGKLLYDGYIDEVIKKDNIYYRLTDQYSEYLDNYDFVESLYEEFYIGVNDGSGHNNNFGILKSTLEYDKEYNIIEFGHMYGIYIVRTSKLTDLSNQGLERWFLDKREQLDSQNIAYGAIELHVNSLNGSGEELYLFVEKDKIIEGALETYINDIRHN